MGKKEISHCEAISTPASGEQMEVVDERTLKHACKIFSESYVTYPDGSGKTHISDWFDLDEQDAVDFGILKEPKWHFYSDIRGMEHEWFLATVIKEPMRAALAVTLDAAQKAIAAANERAERLERHVEYLQERDKAVCGCAYDDPDDVCMAHSPKLRAAEALNTTLSEALKAAVDEISSAMTDDNKQRFHRLNRLRNTIRTALAALPAKQGGQS